ncbi:pyridoxal 5'-phosphate synthase subunit PdxT [Rhodotorula paludigena]|uniref:pyridoxal 5'-phosphate synthase subunit PdxT n=1 Tax=Rhodotorula paludigena TaxID=86838 RepID=UPI00317A3D41
MDSRHAVGVLALQGSFAEHIAALEAVTTSAGKHVPVVAVRTPADLARCRALIIPGGESTTISLLIRKSGLYDPLKEFVALAKRGDGQRSIWGTCAGMILLAKEIDGPTSEGWEGFDGMDVRVARNQFGRQLQSFSHSVQLPFLPSDAPLLATFIRAPILHSVLPPSASSPLVKPLARVPTSLLPSTKRALSATGGQLTLGPDAEVVMYRQGDLLACSWHPELNKGETRVHEWWLREMVLHENDT